MATEIEKRECEIGEWDGQYGCSRIAGERTLSYIPEYLRGTARAAGMNQGCITTLHICDECYSSFEDVYPDTTVVDHLAGVENDDLDAVELN